MNYISERIVNLSEYKKKISDARIKSSKLINLLENDELSKAIELAKVINKELIDLDKFEFIIEHRKIIKKEDT